MPSKAAKPSRLNRSKGIDISARNPAIYNGLALTDNTSPEGASILTGVSRRGSPDFRSYTCRGGASGGAVVNAKGDVVGISVASYGGQRSENMDRTLINKFGVSTPPRADNPNLFTEQSTYGWYMDPAQIVTPDFIKLALSSTAYR